MNIVRILLCWMMVISVPASLMAADSGTAMARPYGPAWLNGTSVQQSSAVFPGDLVQTGSSAAFKIRAAGSSVTVLADSLVKLDTGAISLERGSVQMLTSKGMFARAGTVTATPASSAWTEFQLTRADGTVRIVAVKGDLQVTDGSQTTTLPQGQETTQKDSDQAPAQPQTTPVPAAKKKKGAIILAVAGVAAAGAIVGVVATSAGGSPRVISPVAP
jgi:hypothetical protein